MSKILIVSQKELLAVPVFRQEKNLIEIFNILKENNDVKILYLHRNFKIDKEENSDKNTVSDSVISGVEQFCIRDMIKKNLLKKNLINFIKQNEIETIIFMSYSMAQLVIPYIEDIINSINIIVDFRLSNLSYVLQQYKDEQEKEFPNFQSIYRSFRIYFLQTLAVLKNINYLMLDKDCDMTMLEKENVRNVIFIDDIKDSIVKRNNLKKEEHKVTFISINNSNYASKNIYKVQNSNEHIVNESKYSNIIKDINDIVSNTESEYFCVYHHKLSLLPKTIDLLVDYLSFNQNVALSSPLTIYSRDQVYLKSQFIDQRNNNFANWEESAPLLFSDCFVIKKTFFNKVGFFDTKFATLDYALFDFILRLRQIKAYYCTMKDVPVFKSMAVSRPLSLFKKDRNYLCHKWGESRFNMGI